MVFSELSLMPFARILGTGRTRVSGTVDLREGLRFVAIEWIQPVHQSWPRGCPCMPSPLDRIVSTDLALIGCIRQPTWG